MNENQPTANLDCEVYMLIIPNRNEEAVLEPLRLQGVGTCREAWDRF